jgi:1,4-dihydroxy-2-naphthoate octaprenyltransferase
VGYAITIDATTNECYNKQDATKNTDATKNMEEYYQPTQHVCTHDMSGLPVLIRVSVIIFVLFVRFSYLLICAFSSENIYFLIILLYDFSHEPAK